MPGMVPAVDMDPVATTSDRTALPVVPPADTSDRFVDSMTQFTPTWPPSTLGMRLDGVLTMVARVAPAVTVQAAADTDPQDRIALAATATAPQGVVLLAEVPPVAATTAVATTAAAPLGVVPLVEVPEVMAFREAMFLLMNTAPPKAAIAFPYIPMKAAISKAKPFRPAEPQVPSLLSRAPKFS